MSDWILASGDDRAEFDLADGARMTRLVLGGHDLLVRHSGQTTMWWGAFVMAPWTSLLRDGAPLDGIPHLLDLESDDAAWHGVARHTSWHRNGDEASTSLSRPWPWPGIVSMTPLLEPGRLVVTLTVTAGSERMPAAVGWHPWFVRELEGVPVGLEVPPDALAQERDSNDAPTDSWVLPQRRWNDCVRTEQPIALTYPGIGTLRVSSTSPFATLFSQDPQGVCVEPVTSAAERFEALEPGESASITIELAWNDAV